ncbi:MAG: hypothetical protein ACKKMV_00965 [Candidatus Nealsonbacteria bacterium]
MLTKEERKKYWKLYRELPEDLQEASFSEEVDDNINDICRKYGVFDSVDKITEYVGRTFFGLLPPDEFQEMIEKEIGIEKEIAKKVAGEIFRFVFYPVKESLEELYKIEIAPLAKMKVTPPPQEKPPTPPKKEDVYRELVK